MNIPVGYAQVNHKFTGSAAPRGAEVTYGISIETIATASAIAATCHAIWAAEMIEQQASSITLSQTLVKLGPTTTGPVGVHSEAINGDVAAAAVPPQVSVLLRKNTALGGREGQGRMFLPGYTEADINPAGIIDGADVTSLQASANSFLEALEDADLPMVLLHNSATVPTVVESLQVQELVATQRRRLRG